ncbi:hypothetical protein PPL_01419 [Heterostelium album PN500]|uniref:Uncharacterized protein n=1 Tax=Heterostelium pallidum (strain ATCC 26659 / Pp 5 / PN500) TaxID=670386 RepID=D3AZ79_HETP5|nr:hypothetical protein PPL_01419 [Heterostelium album PN500]
MGHIIIVEVTIQNLPTPSLKQHSLKHEE